MSPNACLSMCNFRARSTGILFPVKPTSVDSTVAFFSYLVTPRVSTILSATRVHELNVSGSTVSEYREKGKSCVRIFFQRLNEIWNPKKSPEGLLACQITLMKFI